MEYPFLSSSLPTSSHPMPFSHTPPSSHKKPTSAAEKRANHNATERARRENLNGKFLTLATKIPELKDVRKPSKSQIIQKSIEYISFLSKLSDRRFKLLEEMYQDYQVVLTECNEWRQKANIEGLKEREPSWLDLIKEEAWESQQMHPPIPLLMPMTPQLTPFLSPNPNTQYLSTSLPPFTTQPVFQETPRIIIEGEEMDVSLFKSEPMQVSNTGGGLAQMFRNQGEQQPTNRKTSFLSQHSDFIHEDDDEIIEDNFGQYVIDSPEHLDFD